MAFTVTDLRWYVCVVVEMYAVMAKVVSAMWMVDVEEMGIVKVARVIVVTKILLSALISESRSERGTGRRENCQSRNRKSRVNFVLSAQSHCCLNCDCKRSYHAMF
jgi:hypothetical protein